MAVASYDTVTQTTYSHIVPTWYPGGFLDQFLRKVPFQKVDKPGQRFYWNRTTVSSVSIYRVEGSALPRSATDMAPQEDGFMVRIGDMVELDYYYQVASDSPINQLEMQIRAKKIGIIRTLATQIVEGPGGNTTSTISFFEGLRYRATGPQDTTPAASTSTAGGAPTLDDLRRLRYLVTASDGAVGSGADCYVASKMALRYICYLIDAAGRCPDFRYDEQLGTSVLYFDGIPVYVGQNVETETAAGAATGGTFTSIYAAKLTGETGIRVLHATGSSADFGIEVVDLPLQGSTGSENGRMGKFVSGFYGLLVPEAESVARLHGCDIPNTMFG